MNIFYTVAAIILLILAGIAGYYLNKVRKLNQAQKEQAEKNKQALEDHRNALIKDIQFIANSMVQKQCEITEGCMRITYLINKVDDSEALRQSFPHVHNHTQATAHMPIKEDYKALTRKEQFKLDNERHTLESKSAENILREVKKILTHNF